MNLHRVAIGIVFFLIPIIGYPAIIHVPGDHSTIQAAVDTAGNGDTILIADGTYSGTGNIGIHWDATLKHLVIRSENGRDHCIIDCKNEERGFLLNMGQDHSDIIEGLTITNGWVYGSGGAILIVSTSPRILNCSMVNNTSYSAAPDQYYGGGAMAVYDSAAPIIKGNIIRNNSSSLRGGGIEYDKYASGVLENNIIDGNESAEWGGGGIALKHFSNPLIINNLIINNVSDCRFDGGFGGGISASFSSSLIINNTIANNSTGNEYYDGKGGGIAIEKWEPYPIIRNCIIWNNVSGPSSMNIEFDLHEWMDISYCNVEEDLAHIFDLKPHTNIDSPPKFIDPENGNYQLLSNSPCINKGDPDTTGLHLPSLDLSGNNRIFGDTVDMGTYEYNRPTTIPAITSRADFHVYPNPCSGLLVLEVGENEKHNDLVVRICNLEGKIVKEENIDAAKKVIPINISNQPGGIYFLTLASNRQVLYRQKIIKKSGTEY